MPGGGRPSSGIVRHDGPRVISNTSLGPPQLMTSSTSRLLTRPALPPSFVNSPSMASSGPGAVNPVVLSASSNPAGGGTMESSGGVYMVTSNPSNNSAISVVTKTVAQNQLHHMQQTGSYLFLWLKVSYLF